jgi:hypothetical protein
MTDLISLVVHYAALRRLIGTFYLLAPKFVFCNSDLDKSTTPMRCTPVYAHKVHACEVYACEMRVYEVHAHEIHALKMHA